jgi:hypothetical protein
MLQDGSSDKVVFALGNCGGKTGSRMEGPGIPGGFQFSGLTGEEADREDALVIGAGIRLLPAR